MSSGPDINYPAQPSYGEGMADALRAQVELLTGQGDFKDIAPGGLAGLIPLEGEVRQATVQQDTAALESTMLGAKAKAGITPNTAMEQYEAYVDLNVDLKEQWENRDKKNEAGQPWYPMTAGKKDKASFGQFHWNNYGKQAKSSSCRK